MHVLLGNKTIIYKLFLTSLTYITVVNISEKMLISIKLLNINRKKKRKMHFQLSAYFIVFQVLKRLVKVKFRFNMFNIQIRASENTTEYKYIIKIINSFQQVIKSIIIIKNYEI